MNYIFPYIPIHDLMRLLLYTRVIETLYRTEINSRAGINPANNSLFLPLSPWRSDLNFPRLDKRKYIYIHTHTYAYTSRRRPPRKKTKRKKAKSVLDHGYSSVIKWTCTYTCVCAPSDSLYPSGFIATSFSLSLSLTPTLDV